MIAWSYVQAIMLLCVNIVGTMLAEVTYSILYVAISSA